MSDLPENWIEISFTESCDQISVNELKVKQKDYLEEGVLPVVDQGQKLIGGYTNEIFRVIPAPPPYIVFGDHTKVLKYVDFQFAPGADGIKVLKPIGFYLPRLFDYFLRILGVRIPNKGYARHFQHLASQEIPLPPLAEQHRIVAKIEELFSDLDAGIASLKKAKEQLKIYRQSVLKWAFEGRLTKEGCKKNQVSDINSEDHQARTVTSIPAHWNWIKHGELLQYITSGSRGWSEYYADTGAIFLRMGNLDHQTTSLDMRDIQYVNLPSSVEGKRSLVQKNDILISITADVGMVGIIPENFPEAYINQHVALARPKPEFNANYLAWFLASEDGGQKQFRMLQRGATKVGLGLDDIREVVIPLAPIEEQSQIVKEIESRLSEADNLDKTLDTALAQSESLRQSILKQAFEGKLVPQDPNDEPAEKLLERIRAERAASDEAPKKRQTTEEWGRYGGAPKPRRGKPQGEKVTAAKRRG